MIRSSYKKNNYGDLFSAIVTIYNPKLIVECGILDGYSLLHMAQASSKNCSIFAFDLFDDYRFKHGKMEEIRTLLDVNFCSNVALMKGDALVCHNFFQNNEIDILHIDISNDGDILEKMFDAWAPKVKKNGLILFEGGSKNRDRVKWMIKYKNTPIWYFKQFLEKLGFEFVTLTPYPSITICRKK